MNKNKRDVVDFFAPSQPASQQRRVENRRAWARWPMFEPPTLHLTLRVDRTCKSLSGSRISEVLR